MQQTMLFLPFQWQHVQTLESVLRMDVLVLYTFPPGRTEDVYVEGTVVNVTCDEGFVATYGGVSECQRDGTWTTLPTCESMCKHCKTFCP